MMISGYYRYLFKVSGFIKYPLDTGVTIVFYSFCLCLTLSHSHTHTLTLSLIHAVIVNPAVCWYRDVLYMADDHVAEVVMSFLSLF